MRRPTISHFSFLISHSIEAFKRNQGASRPQGLTLNPKPRTPFLCYNKGNATWAAVASKEGKDET
jgi:hypothetical protein